jgi:hypothetical protein
MEIIQWSPWYLFLITISYIVHRLTDCFSKINIFTIFLVAFLINHGFFVPVNMYVNDQVNDFKLPDIALIRWMSSLVLMYIFFIVGIIFSKKLTARKNINIAKTLKNRYSSFSSPSNAKVTTLFGIIALVISGFTLASLWQPNLILQTLSGGLTDGSYREARINYGEQFSSQDSIILKAYMGLEINDGSAF